MKHGHESSLMVGCPECISETREREAIARWEQAPLQMVTWTCRYEGEDETETLTFARKLKVPIDVKDEWEVDDHYASLTGEAFVMALPDSVDMDMTDWAAETMEVVSVKIGPPIDVTAPVFERTPLW